MNGHCIVYTSLITKQPNYAKGKLRFNKSLNLIWGTSESHELGSSNSEVAKELCLRNKGDIFYRMEKKHGRTCDWLIMHFIRSITLEIQLNRWLNTSHTLDLHPDIFKCSFFFLKYKKQLNICLFIYKAYLALSDQEFLRPNLNLCLL